jgi:hypothetical protein
MIPVGVLRFFIAAKTFSSFIIVMINDRSIPGVFAFDPKMIVGLFYEFAGTCLCFMYSLGENNGRGYTATLHFSNGEILVCGNINLDVRRVLTRRS